ncbi:MAG: glycosyltransferase family 39 protein [Anaerolineae bacterium]|nr:glycosyltransferase family 39 protein [Anaerolineae bacterium]
MTINQWHTDQISRRIMSALFVIAILAGIIGRVVIVDRQQIINHDEGMSFMEATGHLEAWTYNAVHEEYPLYAWVKVGDLRPYMQIEDKFVFDQIRHDLAETEVAPPFYFWVAHVWFIVFGANLQAILTLNTLFSIATLIVIFALARAIFRDRWLAMAVAAAWFINPTATYTSFYFRHYQLFTLLAVLFAYLVYRYFYAPENLIHRRDTENTEKIKVKAREGQNLSLSPYQGLAIVLVAAMGVLTHYMFFWVIVSALAALALRFGWWQPRRIITLVAWLAVAAVIVIALHPQLFESLDRQGGRVEPDFSWDEVSVRGEAVIDQTIQFVLDRNSFTDARRFIVAAGMIVLPVGLLALAIWQTRRSASRPDTGWRAWLQERDRAIFLIMFVLFNYGTTVAQYTFSFSPFHAMINPWYLSVPWAFCVLIPVWLIDLPGLQSFKKWLLPAFMLVMLVAGLLTLYKQYDERVRLAGPALYPASSEQVLIGSVARGVVSPVLINLDDDTDVFLASPEYLLAHPDEWLPQVAARPTVYFVPTRDVFEFLIAEGFTVQGRKTFWPFQAYDVRAPGIE